MAIRTYLPRVALLALAYFAAAMLGRASTLSFASPVWPAAGIGLAGLLLFGKRAWPGILIGTFAANYLDTLMGRPGAVTPLPLLGTSLAVTLEALIGAYLLERFIPGYRYLQRASDAARFTLLAAFSTAVGALLGAGVLFATSFVPASLFGPLWGAWWLGDLLGVIVVAPLVLTWAKSPPATWGRRVMREFLLIALLVLAVNLALLVQDRSVTLSLFPLQYLTLPLLAWSALRLRTPCTLALVTLSSGMLVWATLHQAGPFVLDAPGQSMVALDLYLVTSALMAWLLALSSQERQESAVLFTEIVQAAPDMIFMKDAQGRYELINVACSESLGLSAAEILGKRDDELFDQRTAERIMADDRQVLAGKRLLPYERQLTYPSGPRWLLTTKFPHRSPDGRILGVIGIARDITDFKQALEEQARHAAELAQARHLEQLKSNFVNAVSHELRTPLTSVMGYAEFLEEGIGGQLTPQQLEFVHQLQSGTRRLEYLLNDLLDFARLEAGTFRLLCQEADLGDKVREIVGSLRPQAEEARLQLVMRLPDQPVKVAMDPQRIGQVLLNLLSNAIKFTPAGGRVEILVVRQPHHVRCEVRDTGIGIAREDLPKLFQRFSQVEGGLRKGTGTGLGLSISKTIVEAHGGRIGVESEPGMGSLFWFELPLRARAEGESPTIVWAPAEDAGSRT